MAPDHQNFHILAGCESPMFSDQPPILGGIPFVYWLNSYFFSKKHNFSFLEDDHFAGASEH